MNYNLKTILTFLGFETIILSVPIPIGNFEKLKSEEFSDNLFFMSEENEEDKKDI